MTTRSVHKVEHPEVTARKQRQRPPLIADTMASVTNLKAPHAFANFPSCGESCLNLEDLGVHPEQEIVYNAAPSVLYELGLRYEKGTTITSTGAMAAYSGLKTGRSPQDKRVVVEPGTKDDVWWGPVNFPQSEEEFMYNRERAIDFLNAQDRIYVVDAFAGWDPEHRMKVRIVCSRAYHALFMTNMLVRATEEELRNFGKPDFTVYNAGCFPANRAVKGMSSSASVSVNLKRHEMTILGTQYAGEMKKGVLTVMMYYMPKRGMLPLHSSANEGKDGKLTLFFGLSGTGKTTLSADPNRFLIGDDEHVWHDKGVFNIEGGCYAKCIGLTREQEPEVYDAIKYGAVVENVVLNEAHEIQYFDKTITENTRCSYPLEHIPNAKLPSVGGHATNVVLLTCDAFGVLPPISKLTPEQCMYQFISGYTAKVAGTEMGVREPTPSFSPCFGGPFLVWHPCKYAEMLAEKLTQTGAQAWLVNTGWTGGKYGKGSRMKLRYTRAMIDAINEHKLDGAEFEMMPGFGVQIPKHVDGVPDEMLKPWLTWDNLDEYKTTLNRLTSMFQANFKKFSDRASPDLLKAQPELWQSKL